MYMRVYVVWNCKVYICELSKHGIVLCVYVIALCACAYSHMCLYVHIMYIYSVYIHIYMCELPKHGIRLLHGMVLDVCIYIYIYIYIYTCIYTCYWIMCVCYCFVCMRIFTHICVYVHIMYIYSVYIHTYLHMQDNACYHYCACICSYVQLTVLLYTHMRQPLITMLVCVHVYNLLCFYMFL